MSKIRQKISDTLVNIPGWRTKRKIIVIQSDDWRSIRMPSKNTFNSLLKVNIRVDKCPFCSYDSLENEDDLSSLFEVLETVKDKNGNHPVITANCIMANPDFVKISESKFEQYYFEPFTETFRRYPKCENSFSLWEQGIISGLFYPQIHGREHLNVNRWMKLLENGSHEMLIAFNYNLFGISSVMPSVKKSIMASFDADHQSEIIAQEALFNDAVDLFCKLLKYNSETFIAPNYIWPVILEKFILKHNIKVIQSSRLQQVPDFAKGYHKKYHFTGQRNNSGQIYIVRNCLFEPSIYPNIDWVSVCLRQIDKAFSWGKPAVISTHRLNYIGSIVEKNRENNLELFSQFLNRIVSIWPDVEFLNSQELGRQILVS